MDRASYTPVNHVTTERGDVIKTKYYARIEYFGRGVGIFDRYSETPFKTAEQRDVWLLARALDRAKADPRCEIEFMPLQHITHFSGPIKGGK